MNISTRKTTSQDDDFLMLVAKLDAYLAVTDGDEHAFYNQFNKPTLLKYALVAYVNGEPVGCGAIKEYDTTTIEIKRMFTLEKMRGNGVAEAVITALEKWSRFLGYTHARLETGVRQVEAVSFYKKLKYGIIPNFGPYVNVKNSICFEKEL